MKIFGYLLTLLALYLLLVGEVYFGAIFFVVGGGFSQKLTFSLRSLGLVIEVTAIAYGYHYGFSPGVILVMFVAFILACFNNKRADGGAGWGLDLDFPSFGGGFDGDGGSGGSD